jgi:hypothetical protein
MNLVGIVVPGDRVPAVPGRQLLYCNGKLHTEKRDREVGDVSSDGLANSPSGLSHLPFTLAGRVLAQP